MSYEKYMVENILNILHRTLICNIYIFIGSHKASCTLGYVSMQLSRVINITHTHRKLELELAADGYIALNIK